MFVYLQEDRSRLCGRNWDVRLQMPCDGSLVRRGATCCIWMWKLPLDFANENSPKTNDVNYWVWQFTAHPWHGQQT